MDLSPYIIAVISGGAIGIAAEYLKNRGKLEIKDYNAEIYFWGDVESIDFSSIVVNLQFVNSSGYQKIVTGIKAKFFDGKTLCNLEIKNESLKPASLIPSKDIKVLSYKFYFITESGLEYSITFNKDSFLEIEYHLPTPKTLRITNFKFIPLPPPHKRKEPEISIW